MSCDEFIATLSAGALPSVQLAEHYERCPRCARLWHAEALLRGARADALRPAPAPSERLRWLFRMQPGAARATHPARRILSVLAATAASAAIAFWCVPRADMHVVAIARLVLPGAAFALLLVAALQLYAYRGRSGLGVSPRLRWAFVAVSVVSFEIACALDASHGMLANAALGASPVAASKDCLVLGLAVAAFVGLVTLRVARDTVLIGAASAGALAGSIAGLAAVTFLHLHCAASDAPHLAIVHALPLLCAIGAGAFAGRRALAA